MVDKISSNEFTPEQFAANIEKTLKSKWFWVQIGIGIVLGVLLFTPADLVFVIGIVAVAVLQAFYKPVEKFFTNLKKEN